MNLFRNLLNRQIFLIGISVGCVAFLMFIFYFVKKDSNTPVLSTVSSVSYFNQEEQPSFGLPVRLKIPTINVNSIVEHVGLTSDGAMDVPKNQNNVAWFQLGQRPGENGSAVIAGHYGWKDNKTSAFDNLYKLKKGDKLYIEDENGISISFVVHESRSYDYKVDAANIFNSYDEKSHLNLITCEGIWDKITKNYSKRLVVFTDREF